MHSVVALQDITYQHEINNTLLINIGTKVLVVTTRESPELVNIHSLEKREFETYVPIP